MRIKLLYLLPVVILFFVWNSFPDEHEKISLSKVIQLSGADAADSAHFAKEGELTFLAKKSGKEIVKIDIEIADNDFERTRGLMYRRSLPDKGGMLFIFGQSGNLSFWMRNTYISLDIIFADEKKKIVGIKKYAEPLSYTPVQAENARYVVEVNAGFCDKYGIQRGDVITFQTFNRQHPDHAP